MSEQMGNACKAFYDTSASATSGTNEIALARDVELQLSATEVDKTSRASGGWKGKRAGLREWGATFDMIYDKADPAWIALKNAFLGGTSMAFSFLDGPKTGGSGINGRGFVTEFTRGEPLDDVVTTKVTIVGDGAPTWS